MNILYLTDREATSYGQPSVGSIAYISIDLIKMAIKEHADWILDYDEDIHTKEEFHFHSSAFVALTNLLKEVK